LLFLNFSTSAISQEDWLFTRTTSYNDAWHPYVRKFIDAFGSNHDALSGIIFKPGTYSRVGLVVSKLETDERILI
jgi:hypothetical protein